jgi:hypothetical protein
MGAAVDVMWTDGNKHHLFLLVSSPGRPFLRYFPLSLLDYVDYGVVLHGC